MLRWRKEALVVSSIILDTVGLEDDVKNLSSQKEDRTVEVNRWITEVLYDAFKVLANAC